MKESKILYFIILISFQILFNLQIVKSFGIDDAGEHLLIYFLQEKKKSESETLSSENYMKELMYNEIYTTFNIGRPKQYLKFYYEMNNYESYISEEYYYKKRSATYKLLDNKYNNISLENNNFEIKDPNGYLSQDILELDTNKKVENFTFLLKPKFEKEKNQSININKIKDMNAFGLSYRKNDSISILTKLKEKKYINKKVFSFLFGDDSLSENKVFDGQVLLGCYPHDISPYFDESELYFISLKEKENEKWHILFDTVKYNNDELKSKIAELDINLNIIIGPEKFRQKLLNTFFRESINNNKCQESDFISEKDGKKYIFYSFDNDVQFNEIPNLSFYSKDLNDTFNISFSKLFIRYNQRYYFNIIFRKIPDNKWVFGRIFFNDYRFVFDLEEGAIGYYKSYSNKNHPFIILICVVVFAVIFILGYWRGKVVTRNNCNLYNNIKPNQVREEYADPTKDNIVNNKKEEKKYEKEKKEGENKEEKKKDDKKIKKD